MLTIILLFIITTSTFAIPTWSESQKKGAIIVAQDGSGKFTTINEAIASVPVLNKKEVKIFIKKGVYNEKVFIDRPNITLIGEARKETQIVYPILWENWEKDYNAKGYSTQDIRWGCATLNISHAANDCSLINLTVYNNYGTTVEKTNKHQFTVFGRATRTIIIKCDIISDGADNLSLWNKENGMYYHADCFFKSPGVDFVCPRGWCYIENCTFEGAKPAQIWHDGDANVDQKFVLKNCRFEATEPSWLGRFHREHQIYLINCSFSESIIDEPIRYAYKDKDMPLKHGRRVYYYNCKRDNVTFDWMKNNLHEAKGNPKAEIITIKWTFDNKWNPKYKL